MDVYLSYRDFGMWTNMDGQTGPNDLKDLTTLERAIDLYLTMQS